MPLVLLDDEGKNKQEIIKDERTDENYCKKGMIVIKATVKGTSA
jgi:hypothetical protein